MEHENKLRKLEATKANTSYGEREMQVSGWRKLGQLGAAAINTLKQAWDVHRSPYGFQVSSEKSAQSSNGMEEHEEGTTKGET